MNRLLAAAVAAIILTLLSSGLVSGSRNKAIDWANELTGETEGTFQADIDLEAYKQQLLQYVFKTDAPSSQQRNSDKRDVPYVMTKLYSVLANRENGQEKSNSAFSVDYIRGLSDHWETERRMQFWFNTSAINETEDVIKAYFHIYKKRAIDAASQTSRPHYVDISLYKIVDEDTIYNGNGTIGSGAEFIHRKRVSAYATEWIIFQENLTELTQDWVRNPASNKGFLVSATDNDENHVNGTHIDFVQRGENPRSKQPVFVIYTDQERKKSNRQKRKQRSNIDFIVTTFLNEDTRQQHNLQTRCRMQGADSSIEECATVVMRQRRSLPEEDDIMPNWDEDLSDEDMDDGYDDTWEDETNRTRRRSRNELELQATMRGNNQCQVKPLYISFELLKWTSFVIAPAGMNADYCNGTCSFPLTSSLAATNHAMLRSISTRYKPELKDPCCTPDKLTRMTVLYHYGDNVVVMKNFEDMIVQTCSCR